MATAGEAFNLALQHHQAGRLQEAEALYRQILQVQPDHADALHNLGLLAYQAGDSAVAIDCLGRAIGLNPGSAELQNDMGRAYRLQGKLEEAEACYRQAVTLKPAYAEAHHNLGNALQLRGKHGEAVTHYRRALALQPALLETRKTLVTALYHQGNLEEAEIECRQALAQQPASAEGFSILGNVLLDQRKLEEAEACYRQALTLNPASAETHMNLGTALHHQGKLEEAEARCRQGLALNPALAESHVKLGNVLKDQGKLEDAEACYRRALTIQPRDGLKIALATMLPEIYPSAQELRASRRRFEENVDALLQEKLTLNDPVGEVRKTQFLLPYQGMNDRELQEKMAKLYERACPSLLYNAPHCLEWPRTRHTGPIKIGFISHFFRKHSIGNTTRGMLASLSREKFSVYAFFVPPVTNDEFSDFIRGKADKSVVLPNDLGKARETIAQEKLDILFYQDIGMEPFTYFLAFARLAPVQCVYAGHPVTTGIPAMDYFISSELLEPKDADKHYSERLIQLTCFPVYYYRHENPTSTKSKKDYGLGDGRTIYFCSQTPFKFHPEFDEVMANILRADPNGLVVLVEGQERNGTQLLKGRLERTIPDVMARVRILPRMSGDDFLRLLSISEVVLDTIHFGGGTTSLMALGMGSPVVTWPGEFMRGRVTYACYKLMRMMDCVAGSKEDYVKRAVRLGTDPAFRKQVAAKIIANNHVLFENLDVVREFERFFLQATKQARNPKEGRV